MDKGYLLIGGITVVVIAALIGFAATDKSSQAPLGQSYPELTRDHIPIGSSHEPYNSNPPSSGPHYAEPAPWGVKTDQLPDEQLVHNLEHGGIWIAYQPEKVDQATIDNLTNLAKRYKSKVILEPRKENDTPISLVSWTHVLKLDHYDEQQIKDFIARNKNKAPEDVPDMGV